MRALIPFLPILLLTSLAAEPAGPGGAGDLDGTGIPPTVAGVAGYLASQVPSEEALREAESWIDELRSPEFTVREKAERALLATANPPVDALAVAAAATDDPETALRAARILKSIKTLPRTTLHRALRWAESSPDRAFVPRLLTLAEFAKTGIEKSLIHRALSASTTADDLPLLVEATASTQVATRAATASALSRIDSAGASDALATLSVDDDESIRLAAATALADRADRRCLAPLGKLLLSDSTATRMRAHHLLGQATGKEFKFSAYAAPESREAAARAIQDWIAGEGSAAPLVAAENQTREQIYVGRTVVGQWPDSFQHYDADGNLLFSEAGYKYVWGCHATADGQLAVVDAKRRTARVYDAAGKEIWVKADLAGEPSDIKILENGNRLITLSTPSRVIELDLADKLVWEIEFPGKVRSTTAQRLPNGNTLVNLQFAKKVVEVNPAGETVWELTGLKNCLTAQGLPDGNVLVCEMSGGKAVEYNREGEVVWEKDGFANACQAQRIPNGNTLVSDKNGIHEVDQEGNEISKLPVNRGRFWRY